MKTAFIFLADGFEEIEAITPADILRRADVSVTLVSVSDSRAVRGARGVTVAADTVIDLCDIKTADMIILPGGYPGYEVLAGSEGVIDAVRYMLSKNRYVAAICGAPAAVLGANGFLKDRRAVCYPGMEEQLGCSVGIGAVCADGNIITARSAGAAMEFSLTLAELLAGAKKAQLIKESIVYNG